MINGLDIYYSKKEQSHGKSLAPISTNKKHQKPISNKGGSCQKVGSGLRILQ